VNCDYKDFFKNDLYGFEGVVRSVNTIQAKLFSGGLSNQDGLVPMFYKKVARKQWSLNDYVLNVKG